MSVGCWLIAGALLAQEIPQVRQLVIFDFLPERTAEAIGLFRDQALPLYQASAPMLRFRAYREVESPESLDLVVVSSFRGMAGMDDANRALAEEARRRGGSVGGIYSRVAALSAAHRDEFVEIDPALSWGEIDSGKLVVFVSERIVPGKAAAYRTLLRERVVPWEKERAIANGSEGGPYLLSDGFDFFRAFAVGSLADWHRYRRALEEAPFARELDEWIDGSRQVILASVPELSVR